MKKMLIMGLAICALASVWAADNSANQNGVETKEAVAPKKKPKPKKPMYTKYAEAVEAATEWEQPILAFVLFEDDDSMAVRGKVMNRPQLKTFFQDNFVTLMIKIPAEKPKGRGRNRGKPTPNVDELKKDERTFVTKCGGALAAHSKMEYPAIFLADSKGTPKGYGGNYDIEEGAGAWVESLESAMEEFKLGTLKKNKDVDKLIAEKKPDGRRKKAAVNK